ncbi:helix-turn-helix domain-containing protein [Xanthomonas nasturtii]|nr:MULTISPECIES: helix-turn-helix domain-containing protein [Xanthomonas]KQR07983.1 HxlR family transcriptional regulator [Xanthomonas sp. Leaf148]MEA9554844.1 helix-turn-helix domain-containing protein [Xanthomonas nasturtii]
MNTAMLQPAFKFDCPGRETLEQLADKWSVMVLACLLVTPLRFNAIKRNLEGVSQKALTQCLRRLERNGIIVRTVIVRSPIAVEYRITPLGLRLKEPIQLLCAWTLDNQHAIEQAREAFDREAA